jgi:hypothetical protein
VPSEKTPDEEDAAATFDAVRGMGIAVLHFLLDGPEATSTTAAESVSSNGALLISLEHRMYPVTWYPLAS